MAKWRAAAASAAYVRQFASISRPGGGEAVAAHVPGGGFFWPPGTQSAAQPVICKAFDAANKALLRAPGWRQAAENQARRHYVGKIGDVHEFFGQFEEIAALRPMCPAPARVRTPARE